MGVEAVHVYRGCCVALACGIWDRKRCPQLKSHTWGMQVTCLIVVEDIVRAFRGGTEIAGLLVRKGSEGEGVGIKNGGGKSPLVGLAKPRVLVFVCILITELSALKGNKRVVTRLVHKTADQASPTISNTRV